MGSLLQLYKGNLDKCVVSIYLHFEGWLFLQQNSQNSNPNVKHVQQPRILSQLSNVDTNIPKGASRKISGQVASRKKKRKKERKDF